MKNLYQKKRTEGFTIIEVMIVLAIVGVIMLIVFMAIPALQRNSRNTQRKNDAARIGGLISAYQANNQGKLPASICVTGTCAATTLNLLKDNEKDRFSILDMTANKAPTACVGGTPGNACVPGLTKPTTDSMWLYVTNAQCSSSGATANTPVVASSSRAYAIYYYLEGSTDTQCFDS